MGYDYKDDPDNEVIECGYSGCEPYLPDELIRQFMAEMTVTLIKTHRIAQPDADISNKDEQFIVDMILNMAKDMIRDSSVSERSIGKLLIFFKKINEIK